MTHTGQRRTDNQDSFFALELPASAPEGSVGFGPESDIQAQEDHRRIHLGPRGALLIVADGMGGAAGGELASRLAVTSVVEALERTWRGAEEATEEFAERLRDSIVEAHARIRAYARDRPWFEGMGTTVTAAGVLGRSVAFAQVGDSRAYLLREEELVQITRDQTWVQQMIDVGTMTPTQARESPRRSVLLQALGTTSDLLIPVSQCGIMPGDILLLCSDGLSSVLDDGTITDVLLRAPNLREACATLVEKANDAGGPDNITALLAEPLARRAHSSPETRAFGTAPGQA